MVEEKEISKEVEPLLKVRVRISVIFVCYLLISFLQTCFRVRSFIWREDLATSWLPRSMILNQYLSLGGGKEGRSFKTRL